MYESLDQFIADLPRAAAAAKDRLAGHSGRFRLTTRQGRTFFVLLEDGCLSLPEALDPPYDCTASADEQVLLDLLNGRINPVTALLFRRVTVQGNMALLMELARLV